MEHFDVIYDSPSEIYHHALPFSPSSSWLHQYYSLELLQEVKVVKDLQTGWGTCSRTVSFDHTPKALACWNNLIAVGTDSGDITILDAITGIPMSVLSSHTGRVNSVAFSSDGTFLVSGSDDKTAILWDIQTGGVINTFCGHAKTVFSVSISPDCTMVASGSEDHTIWLWDTQTGRCHCVIKGHSNDVSSVCFSPINSQSLRSASRDGTVRQWDIKGHQIGSTYEGNYVAFSSDGTNFVSWGNAGAVATVRDSISEEVVAGLWLSGGSFYSCCLSPNGRFIAGNIDSTIHIWDISMSDPCIVQTFIGHTNSITSLAFSSSLISSSYDNSIKFWPTSTFPMDSATANSESTPLTPASIQSINLQAAEGIVISSDSAGVVKTWDILTGLCKESFQTPASGHTWRDVQQIDCRLILIWFKDKQIHIWEAKKGEPLQTLDVQIPNEVYDFKISGDKSKVLVLGHDSIQAWSIWTGDIVGEVELKGEPLHDSLVVDGSKVWVLFEDSQIDGWEFEFPEPTPIPLSTTSPGRPHLHFIGTKRQKVSPSGIKDVVTGKVLFQLSGKYARPDEVQWDGRYLVAGYYSGEILILDFAHVIR